MKRKEQVWRWFLILIVLYAARTTALAGNNAQMLMTEDVVAEWNREAARLAILSASGLAPVRQTRTMAIVQVSVSDAVNGVTREFETYGAPGAAPGGASPEAAAIAAAHHALRNLYPTQAAALDAMFQTSLFNHGLSPNDPGVAYGAAAAAQILALRANDGAAQAQYPYTAPSAGSPGVYVALANQTALLPGWGGVTPWVLHSGSQFRPDAPPALDSERYARDYNEIKLIGALNSPIRTAEQTQIAAFWLASPVAVWNQTLLQLNGARDFGLSKRARTFALAYLAAADAGIACWDGKYYYNFWRPQSAIRRGAEDGNDATDADTAWAPLFTTPPHPEYPSGHTTVSTGIVSILRQVFGDKPDITLTATVAGITRQWNSFDEGLDEVIDARIFSGIHFRTADEVGSKLGGQVARFVMTHALRPCRGKGVRCGR